MVHIIAQHTALDIDADVEHKTLIFHGGIRGRVERIDNIPFCTAVHGTAQTEGRGHIIRHVAKAYAVL